MSLTAFIRPDERKTYDAFRQAYFDKLAPRDVLEQTLGCQIVQAAWRLRRCALAESAPPAADATGEQLQSLQVSIDRTRAAAERHLNRNLAELRRVQSERAYRTTLPKSVDTEDLGLAGTKGLRLAALAAKAQKEEDARSTEEFLARTREYYKKAQEQAAKQTQSEPAPQTPAATEPPPIPRNAPCPCGSSEKYKRCCGRNAPPVLSRAA